MRRQTSQNLPSNFWLFASALILGQAPRRSGFSGAKAYLLYVEVLKKRTNNVGRTFCDAIIIGIGQG